VVFFDGLEKKDYIYQIVAIDKNSVILNLEEILNKNSELRDMILYQATPNKLTKLEYIIQKCVEV
jgi:16S rRNA U1498 N3-methylase RsmE